MKRLVLVLAGCASPPPPKPVPAAPPSIVREPAPAERATRMLAQAPCAIRDRDVTLAAPLVLRYHGKAFASVEQVTELELRAAAVGATAAVITPSFYVVGDVALERQAIRPREVMQQGWLGLRSALPASVADDTITLDLVLPPNAVPTVAPFFRLPCRALTFAEAPPLPTDGTQVWLRPGTQIALRDAPRGKVVVNIDTPRVDPAATGVFAQHDRAALEARLLAREGDAVRVRIGSNNTIEGWIDAAMLGPTQPAITLGKFAAVRTAVEPTTAVRCPDEVEIFVRDPEVTRVGAFLKGATILRYAARGDEVPVDLGVLPPLPIEPGGGEPAVEPFVRAKALTACM